MRNLCRRSFIATVLALAVLGCHEAHSWSGHAGPVAWQTLFNGRDFSGWYAFLKGLGKNADPDRIFQIDDGMIHIYKVAGDASRQPFGYLCTNDEYGDCRVRLEYKWGQKRFAPRDKSRRDSGLLYF